MLRAFESLSTTVANFTYIVYGGICDCRFHAFRIHQTETDGYR